MNNKGFMMAEVIVVASIILLSLTGFYALYTRTISEYNTRIDYNDVNTLYELADFRNNPKKYTNADDGFAQIDYDVGYKKQIGYNNKVIYLLKYDKLNELRSSGENINQTFSDYLGYLASKFEYKEKVWDAASNSYIYVTKYKFKYNDHILVMEKCNSDKTDCKYAYLETAVK